jgi:Holliday junction resolvase
MKTLEGRVKDEIKKWLKEQGAYVFSPVQTGLGSRTLDLLVCAKGRFIAIEVKRPGGVATKLQAQIIVQIQDAGGDAFCVDSLEALKQTPFEYD